MIKAGRPAPAVPFNVRHDRKRFVALMRAKRGFALSRKKRGFTLVELLVVIAIIAILAAILSVAVGSAIYFINVFTISMEVKQLEQALTAYQSKYGSYPPCVGIPTAYGAPTQTIYYNQFKRHIDTAFRNHRESIASDGSTAIGPTQTAISRATQLRDLDASEALPFFLGGAAQYSGNVIGLKSDPIHPLTGSAAGTAVSFYTFNPEQLVDLDGDGIPSYIPKAAKANGSTPFVYFNGASYKNAAAGDARLPALTWPPADEGSCSYSKWIAGTPPVATQGLQSGYDPGIVRPYINGRPVPPAYYETDKFQLLSAGMDSAYGADASDPNYPKAFANAAAPDPATFKFLAPAGDTEAWLNMSPKDEDNVANFTGGRTMGDIGME
jgi:prepilin-type N-terminal cleavage/methylation domain-containing protein